MSFKVGLYKFLLGTIGKMLPLKRRPFGKISNKIRVHYARNISKKIDKNVTIEPGAQIMEDVVMLPGTAIGPNCLISKGTVFEGNNMMGPNVMIYTSSHKYNEAEHMFDGQTETRPVHIGSNVWIGYGVIILPGVTIGSNTIVGAGSVVTKSFSGGVLIAGNPAVVKRIIDKEIFENNKEKKNDTL